MALNWNWNNKIGEMVIEQCRGVGDEIISKEYTLSLYEGNALLIMLYEYKNENGEDVYDMFSFFVDKTHAKKCRGLQKNGDGELVNIFNEDWQKCLKLRINKKKSRNWKDIITLFVQAFDNLAIEIYNDEC